MKKASAFITAFLIAFSAASAVPSDVFAASEKADLPPEVVHELTSTENNPSSFRVDQNEDGIITVDELKNATHVKIDLENISDISFFSQMPSIKYLDLSNGDITDYSVLTELKDLKQLRMFSIPMTDLSSLEGLHAEDLVLSDMKQITAKQRVDFLSPEDVTMKKFSSMYLIDRYRGILNDYTISYTVDDEEVCSITDMGAGYGSGHSRDIFAKKAGETNYHFIVDGEELASGKITVEERDVFDPPVHEGCSPTEKFYISYYYDKTKVILRDETLYAYEGNETKICEENVQTYTNFYRITKNREYHYFDVVLKKDGTLIVNGNEIKDQKFAKLQRGAVSTNDGKLFLIYGEKGKSRGCTLVPVCDDLREMTDDPESYYISKSGNVMMIDTQYDDNDTPYVTVTDTEILNPSVTMIVSDSWPGDCLFLDENNTVWRAMLKYSKFEKIKVAEKAASLGRGYYEDESREIPYFTTDDGKYFSVYTDHVEFVPSEPEKDLSYGYLDRGSAGLYVYAQDLPDEECFLEWFQMEDKTLAFSFMYQYKAITNVEKVLGFDFDSEKTPYFYFMRTDGSIWNYCYKTEKFEEKFSFDTSTSVPETIKGDLDENGEVNAADVLSFQKYLLSEDDNCPPLSALDMNDDGKVNILDFILLKNNLVKKAEDTSVK